jgi:hypothetical protein
MMVPRQVGDRFLEGAAGYTARRHTARRARSGPAIPCPPGDPPMAPNTRPTVSLGIGPWASHLLEGVVRTSDWLRAVPAIVTAE